MPDLLTLPELRVGMGFAADDATFDTQYTSAISAASKVVSAYAQRDFGAPNVTETRTYPYDGSGFLDIDDCTLITEVAANVPNVNSRTLDALEYVALPPYRDDSPVFYYLLLPSMVMPGISPEMGFTRNLDRYVSEYGLGESHVTISVAATWGWPVIPADVKQAVIWTIQDWLGRTEGEGLTAESIEGYSRAWGSRNVASAAGLAVPDRARDILSAYEKISV